MDGFRFILENPHPNATGGKQRKRARLVTACDSCRVKKIKCQQTSPGGRCEACKTSKSPCLFGDRDRYQAERGVTCSWSNPTEDPQPSPDSRKRKQSSDSQWSYPMSYYEQHAGPSYNTFPLQPAVSQESLPLFDPHRPRYPHPYRMRALGNLFFDTIGDRFSFLDRFDVLHRIEHRTCSDILSNTIAALALRYTDPTQPDASAGAPYFEMAKALANQVVSAPSIEALHALLCISFAEYGAGHDDSFWSYSRMAITMCLDLGLGHEATIRVAAVPETRERLRFTWWTVVCCEDIAASWATGRPTVLDLSQYDTALPSATDERTVVWRLSIKLLLLRAKLNHLLESLKDDKLEWKLSELRVELMTLMQSGPSFFAFNEHNLLHSLDRRYGSMFVFSHLTYHAMSILLNCPSILPTSNLPRPSEGPRTKAARTSAKTLVDILTVVQNIASRALCEPFMDLPILTAARWFIVETEASSSTSDVTQQWNETLLCKCKDALVRLAMACGSRSPSFDRMMGLHGGMLRDELQLTSPASSFDRFSPSNTLHWLLKPSLVEDNESDSASSFRSSSREVSPLLAMTPATAPDFLSSTSSVLNTPALPNLEVPTLDFTFEPTDLFSTMALDAGSDMFGLPGSFMQQPSTLQLSMEGAEPHRLDMYAGKLSPGVSLFSSLPWITR